MFTGPGTTGDYMNVYIPPSFPCYTDELGTARDFIWNARVSTVNHTQKIKWSILLGSKLCQTELGLLVWVVGSGDGDGDGGLRSIKREKQGVGRGKRSKMTLSGSRCLYSVLCWCRSK